MQELNADLVIERSQQMLERDVAYTDKITKYRMRALLALHRQVNVLTKGVEIDHEKWLRDYIYNDMKRMSVEAVNLLDNELEDILRTTLECIEVRE